VDLQKRVAPPVPYWLGARIEPYLHERSAPRSRSSRSSADPREKGLTGGGLRPTPMSRPADTELPRIAATAARASAFGSSAVPRSIGASMPCAVLPPRRPKRLPAGSRTPQRPFDRLGPRWETKLRSAGRTGCNARERPALRRVSRTSRLPALCAGDIVDSFPDRPPTLQRSGGADLAHRPARGRGGYATDCRRVIRTALRRDDATSGIAPTSRIR
jgi:hypothetical protein